jgi:hypothetical protein
MGPVPKLAFAIAAVACGSPPSPCASAAPPATVEVPEPRPAQTDANAAVLPSKIVRPLVIGRAPAEVLLPDSDCFGEPAAAGVILGYRPLPDAENEVSFFLVGAQSVCRLKTRARAELLLARGESREQGTSCRAWRAENCSELPLSVAVPSPPHAEVKAFTYLPNWQGMDSQSDGLGEARRQLVVDQVPGTTLTLRHVRKGYVAVRSGEKDLDAFWATAFIQIDGRAYLVTATQLVRLSEPLDYQALPRLEISGVHATPREHPWERHN